MCRSIAEGDDDLWAYETDLRRQPLPAGNHFLPSRHAVSWRSTLDDIGDVHVFPGDPRALQDLGEKLTSRANEGTTALIFHLAWCFADEHELRGDAALTKHHLGTVFT